MRDHSSKKLFQEIVNSHDIKRILSEVISDGVELVVRINDNTEIKMKGLFLFPDMRMLIILPASSNQNSNFHDLTIQFDSRDERYFSRASLKTSEGQSFLLFLNPLYRLQRRQYQRLRIPPRYTNHAFLMNVNHELWNEECEVLDLSLDGCSLKLSQRGLEILIGSLVMLDMQIGTAPSLVVIGQICYKHPLKLKGQYKVKVGIRFRPHPQYSVKLHSIVQKLATDIFSNWSKRKLK